MQILLGTHETIIKINSKATNIEYIRCFISSCFVDIVVKSNYILIPKSIENYHHRIFLLKWLYALYVKKTNNRFPELKELLINRQHKTIKILFKKRIVYKITYLIDNNKMINISVSPKNNQIICEIETFLQIKTATLHSELHIKVDSQRKRELLKELINSKNIIKASHIHIFDNEKMKVLLTKDIKKEVNNYTNKARLLLGLTLNDDEKTLKKQYKILARRYHPDMANSNDGETIALYTKKFQNITEAYEILKKAI